MAQKPRYGGSFMGKPAQNLTDTSKLPNNMRQPVSAPPRGGQGGLIEKAAQAGAKRPPAGAPPVPATAPFSAAPQLPPPGASALPGIGGQAGQTQLPAAAQSTQPGAIDWGKMKAGSMPMPGDPGAAPPAEPSKKSPTGEAQPFSVMPGFTSPAMVEGISAYANLPAQQMPWKAKKDRPPLGEGSSGLWEQIQHLMDEGADELTEEEKQTMWDEGAAQAAHVKMNAAFQAGAGGTDLTGGSAVVGSMVDMQTIRDYNSNVLAADAARQDAYIKELQTYASMYANQLSAEQQMAMFERIQDAADKKAGLEKEVHDWGMVEAWMVANGAKSLDAKTTAWIKRQQALGAPEDWILQHLDVDEKTKAGKLKEGKAPPNDWGTQATNWFGETAEQIEAKTKAAKEQAATWFSLIGDGNEEDIKSFIAALGGHEGEENQSFSSKFAQLAKAISGKNHFGDWGGDVAIEAMMEMLGVTEEFAKKVLNFGSYDGLWAWLAQNQKYMDIGVG